MGSAEERVVAVIMVGGPTKGTPAAELRSIPASQDFRNRWTGGEREGFIALNVLYLSACVCMCFLGMSVLVEISLFWFKHWCVAAVTLIAEPNESTCSYVLQSVDAELREMNWMLPNAEDSRAL